jgi:hypothetical protein
MTNIINAFLVLIGLRKAYNPKTHFVSRYPVRKHGKETA